MPDNDSLTAFCVCHPDLNLENLKISTDSSNLQIRSMLYWQHVRVELYLLREIRKSDEQWCEDPHVSRSQTESRWSRIRIDVNANRGLDNIRPRQVNLSEDAVSSQHSIT